MLDEAVSIETSSLSIGGEETGFVSGSCILSTPKGFFRIPKIVAFVVDSKIIDDSTEVVKYLRFLGKDTTRKSGISVSFVLCI